MSVKNEFSLHQPVLVKEVLSFIPNLKGGYVIDCTVGTGGHAEAILANTRANLIGIDYDEESIEIAKNRLAKYNSRIIFRQANFRNLKFIIDHELSLKKKDIRFILYDLGFSSYQLKYSKRGFSFHGKEPLDMRYSMVNQNITAAYIINHYSPSQLYDIIRYQGEERWAARIISSLIKLRRRKYIKYTDELTELILKAVPHYKSKLHPATRTFLALRIVVNDELHALEESLKQAIELLSEGGRVCVISFNSLEDRIVKRTFRKYEKEAKLNILTKKPILPKEEERKNNPCASSAKLRCAEKN